MAWNTTAYRRVTIDDQKSPVLPHAAPPCCPNQSKVKDSCRSLGSPGLDKGMHYKGLWYTMVRKTTEASGCEPWTGKSLGVVCGGEHSPTRMTAYEASPSPASVARGGGPGWQ